MRKILRIFAVAALLMPLTTFAVGLGDIYIYSALNQRLNAQIPVVDIGNVAIDSVEAQIANPQQFSLVGLDRDPNLSLLRFNVLRAENGQVYVQISSTEPLDAPVLTFLLNLTWPNGQMLREYTVFLDPLNYAKQSTVQLQPATANSTPQTQNTIKSDNTYGPTTSQDDLWEIAQKTRPEGISTQQNMVAIFKKNPDAFANNNINRLKAGSILNLPSKTEAGQLTSAAAVGVLKQQDRQTATNPAAVSGNAPAVTNNPQAQANTPVQANIPPQPNMPAQANVPASASTTKTAPITTQSAMPTAAQPEPVAPVANQPVQTLPEPLQGKAASNGANINNAPEEIQLTPENQLQQEGDDFSQTHQLVPPSTKLSATEKALGNDSQRGRNAAALLSQQLIAMQKQLIEKDRQILTLEKMLADESKATNPAKPKGQTSVVETNHQSAAQGGAIQISYGLPWYTFPILLLVILASLFLGVFMQKRRMLAPQYDMSKVKEQPIPEPIVIETKVSEPAPAIDFLTQSEKLVEQGLYQKAIDMLVDLYRKSPNDFGVGIKLMEIYGLAKQKQNFLDCYHNLQLSASSVTQQGLLKTVFNLFPDLQAEQLAPMGGDGNEVMSSSFSLEPSKIKSKIVEELPKSVPPAEQASQTEPVPPIEQVEVPSAEPTKPAESTEAAAQDERMIEFEGFTDKDLNTITTKAAEPDKKVEVDEAVWDKMLSNLSLETEPTNDITPETNTVNPPNTTDENSGGTDWATQIDLAKAYIEMGDTDEAKEILEQVIEKADAKQKAIAQALLEQM